MLPDHDLLTALVTWFEREAKVYPWSLTTNPYEVWVSEVMLQQTVVTAVVGHYGRWMSRWPNMKALALASEEEVMRAWEGLGYYSRGKNLLKSARILVERGLENLPDDEAVLRALPGLGEYTASAVLSFAFGRAYLAVDANLKRIFQRLNAASLWDKSFETLQRELFCGGGGFFRFFSGRTLNAALMQLGQLVCLPRSPRCDVCPLAGGCLARLRGVQKEIPVRKERVVTEKNTRVGVFVRRDNREVFLAHPARGRFSDLWLFPCTEAEGTRLAPRVHTYTRYRDRLEPFLIVSQEPVLPDDWQGRWVSWSEAENLGMPSVYRLIFEEARNLLAAAEL